MICLQSHRIAIGLFNGNMKLYKPKVKNGTAKKTSTFTIFWTLLPLLGLFGTISITTASNPIYIDSATLYSNMKIPITSSTLNRNMKISTTNTGPAARIHFHRYSDPLFSSQKKLLYMENTEQKIIHQGRLLPKLLYKKSHLIFHEKQKILCDESECHRSPVSNIYDLNSHFKAIYGNRSNSTVTIARIW